MAEMESKEDVTLLMLAADVLLLEVLAGLEFFDSEWNDYILALHF